MEIGSLTTVPAMMKRGQPPDIGIGVVLYWTRSDQRVNEPQDDTQPQEVGGVMARVVEKSLEKWCQEKRKLANAVAMPSVLRFATLAGREVSSRSLFMSCSGQTWATQINPLIEYVS